MVNGVKKNLFAKLGGEKKIKFVMTCIFVTSHHNKNMMHDSMIRKKRKLFDDVTHYSMTY
jgi:hypothetical protein